MDELEGPFESVCDAWECRFSPNRKKARALLKCQMILMNYSKTSGIICKCMRYLIPLVLYDLSPVATFEHLYSKCYVMVESDKVMSSGY
jgi:hypothetical protein